MSQYVSLIFIFGNIISSNSSFSYKLAVTKAVKSPMLVKQVSCENTTSLDLKSLPGYPLNNPKKYLYNFLPYRANSGNYSIILNDDRVCDIHYYDSDDNSLKEQQKALIKFAKRNFGVKPLGICEITGHLNIIKCRRLK
jgi:hypothetical protein